MTALSDRYRLLKKLADGSLTEVFQGMDTAGNLVAVKILRPELVQNPEAVGRCLDEAEVCRHFDHPNLIKTFEAGKAADGRVYMVTEFLEGTDLGSHIRLAGPVGPGDLIQVMRLVCEGLAYAHQRNVVHRDLKPENIFLLGGIAAAKPKVIDFGLAHFLGNKIVKTGGVLVGTAEYLAPEVAKGQKADARSDIYAVGAVMCEALTGSPPFTATSYSDLLLKQINDPPPPLDDVAPALRAVIQRCLAKDPAARFQTAAELAIALQGSVQSLVAGKAIPGPLDSTHISGIRSGGEVPGNAPGDPVFGSYKGLQLLGSGGMGEVYLAQHARLGRKAAIKVLRPELVASKDLVERFFQEARSVNQINHEHIVEVYDFVEEPGRVYMVMELLVGATLTDVHARQGPLKIQRIANILQQVCAGLHAAHQLGIVHRDIKPDNIFLTERSGIQDYVKLLDFGVAKLTGSISGAGSQRTMQGMILGTPAYMSPEQASAGSIDFKTDLYALGTILHELLSGKVPFQGNSFGDLMVSLITQPPPPLPPATPGGEEIPEALRALVASLLAKMPDKRPASAAQVADVLMPFGSGAKDAGLPLREAGFVRSRRGPMAALIAGAFLVAGGALLLFGRGSSAPAGKIESPDPPAKASQAGASAANAPATPEPPKEPAKIELKVSSVPAGALVRRMDTGEELGKTPLEARVPSVDREVPVQVSLDGYETANRALRLNANQVLELVLSQRPAPAPAPEAAKRVPAKRARAKAVDDKDDVIDPFAE